MFFVLYVTVFNISILIYFVSVYVNYEIFEFLSLSKKNYYLLFIIY